MPVQFINAEEACRLVPDRATVGLIGGEAVLWKPPCFMKVWNAVSWKQENLRD